MRVNIICLVLSPKMYTILLWHACESKCFGNLLPFLQFYFTFLLILFSPHVFVKKNVFVCFDFVFRGGLQNLFVLMNGKTVDSLYLMGYFYITSIIFPIHLVYGRFACTTNSWCTHDVSMTYFYYAFKLYDGEHKRLAVNEKDK